MLNKSFSVNVIKKINKFNKSIEVDSDKSLSLRGFLIGSISQNISEIKGIKNIFVFPNMGDGGLTVGGACYQNYLKTNIL